MQVLLRRHAIGRERAAPLFALRRLFVCLDHLLGSQALTSLPFHFFLGLADGVVVHVEQ